MKVGSLFSGMEGFGHGFEKAGMELSWWVENNKDCIKVLKHKYPDALGVTDVQEAQGLPAVDLISFGWPCQDLSVAGKRAGLAGSRSGLFWEAMRIVGELSPQWIVGENVPGLLSSNGGRDMGTVVGAMAELGYCVSWALLDTQYFGLAQRRKRLFFVGSLGNTRSLEILFEPDCGPWDTPPRRETGERVARELAPSLSASGRGTSRCGESRGQDPLILAGTLRSGGGNKAGHGKPSGLDENLIAYGGNRTSGPIDKSPCCNAHGSGRYDFESETFVVGALAPNSGPRSHDAGNFHCNQAVDAGHIVAFAQNTRDEVRLQGDGDICGSLAAQPGMKQTTYVAFKSGQSSQARSLGIEEELSPSLEGGGGENNKPCVAIEIGRAHV